MKTLDKLLARMESLIHDDRFEELETEGIEIKPVPPTGNDWRKITESVCAFLNTRGGLIILGIKEEQRPDRRYRVTGWNPGVEGQIVSLSKKFTDRKGQPMDVAEWIPAREERDFMGSRLLAIYVDELPAERKFCFLDGVAYERVLTGDRAIPEPRAQAQEERKEELSQARELTPVSNAGLQDLSLDRLNEYIQLLNRQTKIETMKADLNAALPFLTRKAFVVDGKATTLGVLVCGQHPADLLGYRCRVHCYVDVPQEIAQDKKVLADNILPLMEDSLGYVLRNTQVGVSAAGGGTALPQYPETLLRETVNNALAHRDYSINKNVTIVIRPGRQVEIRNPGTLRRSLLIEHPDGPIPLHRIIPEANPRNPRLADVLMVYNKWEGRGIGMATLTNLCLQDEIDLPYYRLYTEDEVGLHLNCARLVDDRIKDLLQSFDGYIEGKLQGHSLTLSQQRVLAYLIKSEWANRLLRYTILLTPDNNHFQELNSLEAAGLISRHPDSPSLHPVYIVDRILMEEDYTKHLRESFGPFAFDPLNDLSKSILGIVYRFGKYSKFPYVSAKQAAFLLWWKQDKPSSDIRGFDTFYRKVRNTFNKLEEDNFIHRNGEKPRYELSEPSHLRPEQKPTTPDPQSSS